MGLFSNNLSLNINDKKTLKQLQFQNFLLSQKLVFPQFFLFSNAAYYSLRQRAANLVELNIPAQLVIVYSSRPTRKCLY